MARWAAWSPGKVYIASPGGRKVDLPGRVEQEADCRHLPQTQRLIVGLGAQLPSGRERGEEWALLPEQVEMESRDEVEEEGGDPVRAGQQVLVGRGGEGV
jgi:hypothetical protein